MLRTPWCSAVGPAGPVGHNGLIIAEVVVVILLLLCPAGNQIHARNEFITAVLMLLLCPAGLQIYAQYELIIAVVVLALVLLLSPAEL